MKHDQLEDLKQFIDSRISQSEVRMEEKIESVRTELKSEIHSLREEMFDGFAGVGEAIENINARLDKHEKLLARRQISKAQTA